MTHADKNPNIGIYLYLQTYVELSTYRASETCKILSSVLEYLSKGNIRAIPNSNILSVRNMVRRLYVLMHTVSFSLTSLTSCLRRLLKKPGYLLHLCLMRQHLSKINALTSRYAATLEELQTTCPNIVVNLPHSKIRTSSLASLLNALDLCRKALDSDMLVIYRNVSELYIRSMDCLIMKNFPNLERHIMQIQLSLYPSLENYI